MIPANTTAVRPLTRDIVAALKDELSRATWGVHHDTAAYKQGGALRHGESCWIVKTTEWLAVVLDQSQQFPASCGLAASLLQDNQTLARRYWHRLRPGDIIEQHDDRDIAFSPYIAKRYQVFLDIPQGFEIFCDNEQKHAQQFANSVVDFNLFAAHAYANHSQDTVYLMVFDVFDKTNLPVR